MAIKLGKCINIGNDCKVADSKQIIEIPEGNDFVCPDCGSNLVPATPENGGRGPRNKILLLISTAVILIVIIVVGSFLYIKKKQTDALALLGKDGKALFEKLKDSSQKKATNDTSQNKAVKDTSHKLHKADTSHLSPPPPRTFQPSVTINNLAENLNKLSNQNISGVEKRNIKKGIVKLFTSPQAEVIPVNSDVGTPTGMTIGNYVEAIIITRRTVKIVDEKFQGRKIFELYISEK